MFSISDECDSSNLYIFNQIRLNAVDAVRRDWRGEPISFDSRCRIATQTAPFEPRVDAPIRYCYLGIAFSLSIGSVLLKRCLTPSGVWAKRTSLEASISE